MDLKSSVMGLIAVAVVGVSLFAYADEYEWRLSREDVKPVGNQTYLAECGSCHFAYQPGLLPQRSWEQLMTSLDDHFGENAELAPETLKQLTDYLVANAAEHSPARVSKAITASVPADQVPLRISELRYIRRQHDELPARVVRDNPEVGSLAKCAACHTGAAEGSYDEHAVRVPGFGVWDD